MGATPEDPGSPLAMAASAAAGLPDPPQPRRRETQQPKIQREGERICLLVRAAELF